MLVSWKSKYSRAIVSSCLASMLAPVAYAAPGVTESEIRIGVSVGLTGDAAAQCKRHMEGVNLYFKKTNDAGGIHGRKIRPIIYDDGYEPTTTLLNTKRLVYHDDVFLLFKYYGTATLKAVLPLIDKENIPVLSPSSGAEFLRNPVNKNIFMVKGGYFLEAEQMIDFLVKKGKSRIAILYQNDAFGHDGRNGTLKALDRRKMKPVAVAPYTRNSQDMNIAFEEIRKAEPDTVILWGTVAPSIEFVRKSAAANFKPLFVGNSSVATSSFAAISEGAYVTMGIPIPEDTHYPITQQFVADAKAADIAIDPTTFHGYLDATVLVEALRRTGADVTRDSFRHAMENKMKDVDFGGLKMSYSSTDHQGLSNVFFAQVKNGKFVAVHE